MPRRTKKKSTKRSTNKSKRSTKRSSKKPPRREGRPELMFDIKPRKAWRETLEGYERQRLATKGGVFEFPGCISHAEAEAMAAEPAEFWLVRGLYQGKFAFLLMAQGRSEGDPRTGGVLKIKSLCATVAPPDELVVDFTDQVLKFAADSGYRTAEFADPVYENFARQVGFEFEDQRGVFSKELGDGRPRALSLDEVQAVLTRNGNLSEKRLDLAGLEQWAAEHPDPDGYFVLQVKRKPPLPPGSVAPEFWDGMWRELDIYLVVPAARLDAVWRLETDFVGQEPVLRYNQAGLLPLLA